MTGPELGLEEHPVVRIGGPQLGHPLGRLPETHPGIGKAGRSQDVRVPDRMALGVHGANVVVGRVRLHDLVDPGILDGVAPLVPLDHGERKGLIQDGGQAVDEGHLSHDGPEEIGRQVGHRPHQQPSGTAPAGHQPVPGGPPFRQQGPGAGHEVGEGVGLGRQLALLVPGAAHLPTPADVGDGEDEAPVEEAEAERGEHRIHGGLVRPVAVEEARSAHRPVAGCAPGLGGLHQVGPVHQRDRDLGPVVGHRPQPSGPVAGRIEVTEDRQPLEQVGLTGAQVQVVHGPGGDQGGVLVPEGGRVVLGVGATPHRGGGLALPYRHGPAGGGIDHPYPGLAPLPLIDHQVSDERIDVVQADSRPPGYHLGPVGPVRRILGCLHQSEVLGPVVGDDEEPSLLLAGSAPVVVHAVLDALAPGLDDHELPERFVGRQHPDLGGDFRVQAHEHELLVLGPAHPEVEVVVGLFVDQDVPGGVTAHPVPPQLVRAHGFVDPHVEDRGVVVGPGHPVGGVGQ